MEKITVLGLLRKYERWVKNGEIQFLRKGSAEQKSILALVRELISDFQAAEDKQKTGKGDISENLDWYKTHQNGRDLWKELASSAVNNIDKDSKGNSTLFEFLEAATEFEDIMYGLEPYYRDHTLHSLWVYFIGEYILRELLSHIHDDLNWYLYNDIEKEKSFYPILLKEAIKKEKEICKEVTKHKDAVWCLMALCHDLGYSLAQLNMLNEKVKNVLRFFDLPNFRHIGYSLDIEHQYIASQFLDLMAMEVRIVPSSDKKDVLIKCYRDDSTYWRLCRGFEKKQHGILSSYLIYKILDIFAEAWMRGTAEEWGLDDEEAIENIIRGDILFAIAQHEFDFAHLNQLSSLADILILADELEEVSRYGREMLSRKYHDTTADTAINFKPNNPKQGNDVEIYITYEVAKHHSLNDFFKRKAQSLCRIYSLEQEQGREKFSTIKSLKMTAEGGKEGKKLNFNLFRDSSKNEGYLPKTKIDGKEYKEAEYPLICIDDKIYYFDPKGRKISFDEWFENVGE